MSGGSDIAVLIDVGSTWTKGVAVSLPDGRLLARRQHPTTRGDGAGIMRGVAAVTAALGAATPGRHFAFRAAASSAAGGLRVAALGLVPDLTGTAARRASLGAGARVVFTGSYVLAPEEIEAIREAQADIVLLTGGTDGGNAQVLLENARRLAQARLPAAVVLAGNRSARAEARALLAAGGCEVRVAENVLPRLDALNVESAQAAIREVFLERIVVARGIEALRDWATHGLLPTPRAVLDAAAFLADGPPALGTTVVVDIGGATTDVHSVGGAEPGPGAVLRGLPEPRAKRTVEGDLGLRVSAAAASDALGAEALAQAAGTSAEALRREAQARAERPELLRDAADPIDRALAVAAVAEALHRHAGEIEPIPLRQGMVLQVGKDLRRARALVASGGIFAARPDAAALLGEALARAGRRGRLVPEAPRLLVDRDYVLFAVGLLAPHHPGAAAALAARSLEGTSDAAASPAAPVTAP
ncbi:hypothetical protein GCM10010964_42680 [Caldovatus sediminis]|uniref:Glutamate mutase n=1 Tax=Caldovatus sediminis TaxID=2041189 RepID=A0A8J3EE55_9PROT|nr:methylaspartate mutase accessory protein GlmL [Caldovatus sediminis]GGG50853.1 hypothetical protein GCM10010964_42680 [Caldovatus sediminis]